MNRSLQKLAGAALACAIALGPAAASAQPAADRTGTQITGTILDSSSGLAIPGADVTLYRGTTEIARTVSSSSGTYTFANEPPAIYRLVVARRGYASSQSDDVPIVPGTQSVAVNIDIDVAASTGQQPTIRTIGRVSSSSTQGTLQKASTVSRDLSSQTLLQQNYANVGEALNTLPGVDFAGHGSSVGDDQTISLRGFAPSEVQTLLDGHPIGPIGVGGGAYDYQVSPFYALRNTQVTFGAGALGLYGTDATGGAIDFQTIDPSPQGSYTFTQGFGTQGKSLTATQLTGTYGKLGYALGGGVQGTFGDFAPGIRTQTGNLGSDLSPANVAANTYNVSGNYLLRDGIAKLQYQIVPGTVATVTAYSASSRVDKSGVGDNDFQPFSQSLIAAQGNAGTGGCAANLVPITTGADAFRCDPINQAAAENAGPAGGGPNPFQTIVNQDYHGRLVTNILGQSISIDGYVDSYNLNYNRNSATFNPTLGIYTGGFYQNLFRTNGLLVTDDIAHGNNDFGFGYFTQHQTLNTNTYDTGTHQIVPQTQAYLGNDNIFLRDTYSPSQLVTLYTNVYYKLLSTTRSETVDPRATLLLRPTSKDVIRLIAGKTDGEPAAILTQTLLNQTPSNLNPQSRCSSFVGIPKNGLDATGASSRPLSVGTIGASNLNQETASDFEVTYGHAFANGTTVQIGGYNQHTANLLTTNAVNALTVPAGTIPAFLLQQYYARIRQACAAPGYVGSLGDLSLAQASNGTTSGLYRGFEITGRAFATRNLFFDFSYDLQHAQIFGYTDAILAANPTNINGGQTLGFPLNKGSLGAEFNNRHGLDVRLDGYYFGINNAYNRPAYGYGNASFTYELPKTGFEVNLGIANFTNSATQQYGLSNIGTPNPVNDGVPGDGVTELYGQLPRTFLVTFSEHVR